MRIGFQLLLSILVLNVAGCPAAPSRIISPGSLVTELTEEFLTLGNSRVHFSIIHGASPTILLESGGGRDSSDWNNLQPEIARLTGLTVVSYDRPGFGQSDLPSSAYDAVLEMQHLQEGLKQIGLEKQVILVGHSYGGLLNQYYASTYSQSVRGVVLIDPGTVRSTDDFGGSIAVAKEAEAEVRYDGSDPVPKRILALRRFLAGFPDAIETFRTTAFPDIPLIVISAGNPWWPTEEKNKIWRASHESIVAGHPNRSLVVAEGSGHVVMADRPDIVLSAIQDMVVKIQKSHSQ